MKIKEPAREVEVIHETDVLVVGSGPGGLAAAIGAARAGVSVALRERFGCFGANNTAVGVEGFTWYRHEQTIDTEGIGIEFEERAKQMGAAVKEPQSDSHALDGEAFKWVTDTLVEEAGITPMRHRLFVAPVMQGNTIAGVGIIGTPESRSSATCDPSRTSRARPRPACRSSTDPETAAPSRWRSPPCRHRR